MSIRNIFLFLIVSSFTSLIFAGNNQQVVQQQVGEEVGQGNGDRHGEWAARQNALGQATRELALSPERKRTIEQRCLIAGAVLGLGGSFLVASRKAEDFMSIGFN